MKKTMVGIAMALLVGGTGMMVAEARPNYNSPIEKSGILEQFDKEMEIERLAKLEAKSKKSAQSQEDDEEIECELNE